MTTSNNSKILLGNYGTKLSNPFYVYIINNRSYYCIQDINYLFLNGKLTTKANLIKQIFLNSIDGFIKYSSSDNKILIMTRTLIIIARLFNMYCLAELCKLSIEEILGNVSEPILNHIQCENWRKNSAATLIVERDNNNSTFESLSGDEWLFIAPLAVDDTCLKENKKKSSGSSSASSASKINSRSAKIPPNGSLTNPTTALLYQWLSSNISHYNNDPSMIQTLISAAKVKKQQKAIIETRQRQAAFSIIPTTTKKANKKQQHQKSLTRGGGGSTRSYHNTNNIIAGNNATIPDTSAFPPSPPSITSANSSTKRKLLPQEEILVIVDTKKLKTISKEPLSYQQYILNHGNDNLNLLATQATQMRGLPLSPEVSPSPPPFYNNTQQQHRLPSIQVMLSELNSTNNHYHHSVGGGGSTSATTTTTNSGNHHSNCVQ